LSEVSASVCLLEVNEKCLGEEKEEKVSGKEVPNVTERY